MLGFYPFRVNLCESERDYWRLRLEYGLSHWARHVTEKHGVKVSYNWLRLMLRDLPWC
jgi:hypothetical protein